MADVSKIKLPDNSEVTIKDSRIAGVDTTVTSGSSNVVTSGAVYTAISSNSGNAKVYAFNFYSWTSDIVDEYLNIPLATYEEMVADAQNGVPVILRLQRYETSGGVVTIGEYYDFYLYQHYVDGNSSWLYFWQTIELSGIFHRGITLSSSGSTVSFGYYALSHEFKENRVNSITGSGSTERYPTTRAVVNYVAANGGLPSVSSWGHFLASDWDTTTSSYKWKVSSRLNEFSPYGLEYTGESGIQAYNFDTFWSSNKNYSLNSNGLVAEAASSQGVFSDWSWIKYRSSYSPSAYVTLQDTLDSIALPSVTSSDLGKLLYVDYDSTNGYHWAKNSPFVFGSYCVYGETDWGIVLRGSSGSHTDFTGGYIRNTSEYTTSHSPWSWINSVYYNGTSYQETDLQSYLDLKAPLASPALTGVPTAPTASSGTNTTQIATTAFVQAAVSGGGGGSTTDCVHKTGDETVGGDKTFTDNIAVVDASHILYSGASPSQGFTRGAAGNRNSSAANSITFTGLSGEPKAFVLSAYEQGGGVLMVVGDSTGCHGIYNTGSQHNYSASFTKSYSNGVLTVTAPTGVTFIADSTYNLIYYYGDGTLTFKTSQVQPGSGVTAVTFTGNGLTEIPAMYACLLETAVNNEQYRRVAAYTNSAWDNEEGVAWPEGITFVTGGPEYTTSSFSVSYNNGLVINSGGTNAGGYFHNPGTYTLYYLMASDIGGGGGSYSDLADELSDIKSDITALETGKQDTLVSGTSIKTINSTSLLGSGNIAISSLPAVTATNNGQLLEVSNGAWATGRTITISSSEPTAYQGNNGDIWIVI